MTHCSWISGLPMWQQIWICLVKVMAVPGSPTQGSSEAKLYLKLKRREIWLLVYHLYFYLFLSLSNIKRQCVLYKKFLLSFTFPYRYHSSLHAPVPVYFRDFLPSISGSSSSMRIQIRIQEAFDSDLNSTYLYCTYPGGIFYNPEFS